MCLDLILHVVWTFSEGQLMSALCSVCKKHKEDGKPAHEAHAERQSADDKTSTEKYRKHSVWNNNNNSNNNKTEQKHQRKAAA